LIGFVIFFGINRFVPGERIPGKVAAVASLTSASLWFIAGKAFAWYLAAFQPYSKLYGTYTVVLVFFLWIYYSSAVFVAGVVVGQLYRERHSQIST
jgi:membrane protein